MGGMIPLRDASREPKRYPVITISLIVVNVLVFLLELAGGGRLRAAISGDSSRYCRGSALDHHS